jgi:signal transduction histidine kinase
MIAAHRDHAVQFFEDEGFLVNTVSSYVETSLAARQPVLIIATPERRQAFVDRLKTLGVDAETAERERVLGLVDARSALDDFMVGGMPDRDRFDATIGGLVRSRRVAFPSVPLRAYGEMVDLLWQDANPEAAIRLEELWNELAARHDFSLLCAYAMTRFAGSLHANGFAQVCAQHADVRPAEGAPVFGDTDGRGREIARLQQRARALEAEIEHRKRLELALREAVDEGHRTEALLQEAVRTRDDFISIASHELRNPLHAIHLQILSVLHAAERQALSPEWTIARLGRTSDSITRLGRLLDNLLDVSRITAGRLTLEVRETDFADVIRDVVDRSREQMGAVTVTLDLDAAVGRWDPLRLDQIVTNLLSNAVKYGAGQPVTIRLRSDGGSVTLDVEDRGVGIDEVQRKRLFGRFERGLASREGGFGLGLWITRQIVEAMHGTIAVSGEPGQGSVFSVMLPRDPAAVQP